MPDSALPPHLQVIKDGKVVGSKPHWDYPPGLRWIPRGWTAFDWGKPKMIAGNQELERAGAPAPIGERKSWQISRFPNAPGLLKYLPLYFAATFKSGRHIRFGARYDDVDDYTQFPTVASRKYTGLDSQDTSTK